MVIQGTDEKAKGEVTIKDLIVGAELAKLEKGREEHLQKQAEAQFAVAEEKLVEAVRQVLRATASIQVGLRSAKVAQKGTRMMRIFAFSWAAW